MNLTAFTSQRIRRTAAALALLAFGGSAATAQSFKVTNLLSDGFVPAKATDATFINPWGVSLGKTFWTNSAKSGYDALNDINGAVSFKVIVPGSAAGSIGAPSATVAQTNSTLFLLSNGKAGSFLFSTLGGQVSGWNGSLGTNGSIALNMIDHSAQKAVYTGMALATNTKGTYLLLANFNGGGSLEVFDSTWKATTLTGSFTDPTLPASYFPFNVHTIGSQVFVTYIQKNSSGLELVQPGNGIVSVFDTSGNFVTRAVTGGALNAPWGVAKAPATFGIYANDILIGNFGDGTISAYDPTTFAYAGQLIDSSANPIAYPGLWEILVGGGTAGSLNGDANVLYFAAGIGGEAHGLFGSIDTTGTGGSPTFGLSTAGNTLTLDNGHSGTIPLAIEPTNGFTGAVTLSCSGLPVSATCSFGQTTMTTSTTASSATTLIVSTFKHSAQNGARNTALLAVLGLPFFSMMLIRRSSASRLGFGGSAVVLAIFALLGFTGCGGATSAPSTPTGTSVVTVTATSGSISQSTKITLVVR